MRLLSNYERDGFTTFKTDLPGSLMDAVIECGDGERRVTMAHRTIPAALTAMRHPNILERVRRELGNVSGLGSDYFGISPNLPSHQDNQYVLARADGMCSVWIALCDVNPSNGCLEVAPASHRFGLLEPIPEFPMVPVSLKRGTAILLHGDLVHRSIPSDKPRHALLLTYIRKGWPYRAGNMQKREEVEL